MDGERKVNYLSMPALAAGLLSPPLCPVPWCRLLARGKCELGEACPERADERRFCHRLLDRADLLSLSVVAAWQA